MINIAELHREQQHIAAQIIHAIQGMSCDIPYFTYLGPCIERNKSMIGRHGIYIFTVSEDIILTTEMARAYNCALDKNGKEVGAPFRIPYPPELRIGDVFYIGKVSGKNDSIYQRLGVHYGGITNNSTSGIKMQIPERKFIRGKLLVHPFLLDKQYTEISMIIADPVEKILHAKLKPITGKK